jgi:MFS family permease
VRRDTLLVVLTAAGSALCWWPAIIEPSLDFPRWLLLVPVALCTGLSVMLSDGRRLLFVLAAGIGSAAGLCGGFAIWPPSDPIAASYTLFVIGAALGAALLVSVVACLVGAAISEWGEKFSRALWVLLVCGAACGPVVLALTPPLVGHRVARNDRVAAVRFMSLKSAVERIGAEADGPNLICDGQALKRHYSGPPFTESDWRFIVGNYVKQDGYVFGIYCLPQQGIYAIDASPARGRADGTRTFCTDASGNVGCSTQWTGSRNACIPCAQ